MANTVIQLKHSTLTGNVPSSLANGEISINSRDGKFFYSTPANVVVTHYPYPGPAGLNQEVQFNDSGVLGSDSGLTYNKTTDVLTVVGGAIIGGVNVTPQIQLAFTQANTPSYVANSAASYANAAFTRANNSLNANNGGTVTGTITANSFITSGNFGDIQGANTIYANNFVANTGFIQFADGSKQFTANAGSSSSAGTYANAGFAVANSSASYANAAFSTANSALGSAAASSYANSAFAQANTAQSSAGTAQGTADSAAIYANGAFAKANTGTDYFPIGDYGNLTDPSISVFGESLLVAYDCRIDPITPNGLFLTKDFGHLT